MDIAEGLRQLWISGVRVLNVYWLEANDHGETCWWVDVCEDAVNTLCKTRWVWTVVSKEFVASHDYIEPARESGEWEMIVGVPFGDDVVKVAIEKWLGDRGFGFEVNVIDPAGTIEEKRISEMVEDA